MDEAQLHTARLKAPKQRGPLRQPLTEIHNQAKVSSLGPQRSKRIKAVVPNTADLTAINPPAQLIAPAAPRTQRLTPDPQRIVDLSSEQDDGSKRNSAISNTSDSLSGRRRKTFIGHWQLGKTIGKGGCSRVRIVRHRYKDQYGAVKIVMRSTAENTRAQSLANLIDSTKGISASANASHRPIPYGLEREIAVMKLLEHPNVVRLYDVWENRNELYLIMEYVDGGELFHYVDERKGLPEDETVFIFRQIVSALLYCHRLRICHRDLKPENILLNRTDLTVKLIDFGMAALQPEGRLLSTPCGSPHYAAPEVVSSKPYDGTLADVWSCGVILYVMLTGTTPFNYGSNGDIRALFQDIAKASFWMPPELSREAKHLVKRIFTPDPQKRATMDDVWDHPLLHKYNDQFGFDSLIDTKEAAIGKIPRLEDWKVNRAQEIDREILRNMRTLWHSVPESGLIQKLLSIEVNQEKLFYAALVKHREENLENYSSEMEDMGYSTSDYHHSQRPGQADSNGAPLMPSKAQRSQSQYSIMHDEHLRRSPSPNGKPPSTISYDPYRASRDTFLNTNRNYLNVTIQHNGIESTRRVSISRSLRQPSSARIEMLGPEIRRSVNRSNSSLGYSAQSKPSMARSSMSRRSLLSSNWPSSPPVIARMRPSEKHKRGVSFDHLRQGSIATALTSRDSVKCSSVGTATLPDASFGPRSSVNTQTSSLIVHKKPSTSQGAAKLSGRKYTKPVTPSPRVSRSVTPGRTIRNDIRKHSAELEKACEEAFFRSSAGSSTMTGMSLRRTHSNLDITPPTSASELESVHRRLLAQDVTTGQMQLTPKRSPNAYLSQTLAETLEKLAAYKAGTNDDTQRFDEVLKVLESIMPGSSETVRKQSSPATPAKAPSIMSALPIISEEVDRAGISRLDRHRPDGYEATPTKIREDHTIRIVPHSSPASAAQMRTPKSRVSGDLKHDAVVQKLPQPHISASTSSQSPGPGLKTSRTLPVIEENATWTSTTPPEVQIHRKRSGWFGKGKKIISQEPPSSSSGISPHDRVSRQQKPDPRQGYAKTDADHVQQPPIPALPDETHLHRKRQGDAKSGFSRWIGRIVKERNNAEQRVEGPTPHAERSLDSLFSAHSTASSSNDVGPSPGPERSWFARFFHVKPAVKLLCFSIPRGRARQELVLLLKEWQRHGIRDLLYSRETNTISARVDRQNALDIKPVTFRIELFVVLEHGRRVGLSIARFVQVKGAASGFRRVLDVVDGVMRSRNWLVQDEEKWDALCEVVGG